MANLATDAAWFVKAVNKGNGMVNNGKKVTQHKQPQPKPLIGPGS